VPELYWRVDAPHLLPASQHGHQMSGIQHPSTGGLPPISPPRAGGAPGRVHLPTTRTPCSAEFIRAARSLIQRITATDQRIASVMTAVYSPLKQRVLQQKSQRLADLDQAISDWRAGMPALGCLATHVELDRTRRSLILAELRLTGADYELPKWINPKREPALALSSIILKVSKHECSLNAHSLAIIGLHALARWKQRNFDITEPKLLEDLKLLGEHCPRLVLSATRPNFHWELDPTATGSGRFTVTRTSPSCVWTVSLENLYQRPIRSVMLPKFVW
jgi:hypothetical protein